MRGLLLKDVYLLKDNKMLVGIMLAMAILFVTLNANVSFIVAFMTMIMSVLVITTISYDDFDHSNSFLMTLPITRKLYVREKYGLGLLLAGIGWLVSSIFATTIQWMKTPQMNRVEWISTLGVFIILGILCMSIMIPVQLKFGGDKGRLAMVGCILFLFLAGTAVVEICKLANIDLEHLLMNILQINVAYLAGAIIAVVAAGFWLSYRISIRIMMKKQF